MKKILLLLMFMSPCAFALPDVVLTAYAYNPITCRYSATIKNVGNMNTPSYVPVKVGVWVNGVVVTSSSIPFAAGAAYLAANATATITSPVMACLVDGDQKLAFNVDPENLFAETSEDNSYPFTYSNEYVRVSKKTACSLAEFQSQANSATIFSRSYSNLSDGTPSATIDKVTSSAGGNPLTYWSTDLSLYSGIGKPTKAQTDAYYAQLNSIKAFISGNSTCLSVTGGNARNKFHSVVNLLNMDTNVGYSDFVSKYPIEGANPKIFVVDSVVFMGCITPEQLARSFGSHSFVDGVEAIESSSLCLLSHGSRMFFTAGLMSGDSELYPIAISHTGDIDNSIVPDAFAHAHDTCTTNDKCVVNKSFSRADGNNAEETIQIAKLAAKSIPVIEAVDNEARLNTTVPVNANTITVGAVVVNPAGQKELMSEHGPGIGPDIAVLETGTAPHWWQENTNDAVVGPFSDGGTSKATAMVSGIVARIKSNCPDATPLQIRDALIFTAEKLPVLPTNTGSASTNSANAAINAKNGYLRGGLIKPTLALDSLMETVCPEDPTDIIPADAAWGITGAIPHIKTIDNLTGVVHENTLESGTVGFVQAYESKCSYIGGIPVTITQFGDTYRYCQKSVSPYSFITVSLYYTRVLYANSQGYVTFYKANL